MYRIKTRHEAGHVFNQVRRSIPSNIEPLVTLKNTFEEWAGEIMNYFDHPYTNAYTESANALIKALNKDSRSMSFEQLRYKVLFSTKAIKLSKFSPKDADYEDSDVYTYTPPTKKQPYTAEADWLMREIMLRLESDED